MQLKDPIQTAYHNIEHLLLWEIHLSSGLSLKYDV